MYIYCTSQIYTYLNFQNFQVNIIGDKSTHHRTFWLDFQLRSIWLTFIFHRFFNIYIKWMYSMCTLQIYTYLFEIISLSFKQLKLAKITYSHYISFIYSKFIQIATIISQLFKNISFHFLITIYLLYSYNYALYKKEPTLHIFNTCSSLHTMYIHIFHLYHIHILYHSSSLSNVIQIIIIFLFHEISSL